MESLNSKYTIVHHGFHTDILLFGGMLRVTVYKQNLRDSDIDVVNKMAAHMEQNGHVPLSPEAWECRMEDGMKTCDVVVPSPVACGDCLFFRMRKVNKHGGDMCDGDDGDGAW